MRKEQLNDFALNIEFLLISIIQGVALAALGTEAAVLLKTPSLQSALFITAGFLFILIFWSGAIIHALSFIDWPLDLTHNFLYFLVSLIEIIAFSYMTDPYAWFVAIFSFFLSAAILYIVDLFLIKNRADRFTTDAQKKLFKHILKQQKLELFVLIPSGIAYNALCIYLVSNLQTNATILIGIQVIFAFFFLANAVQSFQKRAKLISQSI